MLKKTMFSITILIIFFLIIVTSGQFFFKKGMNQIGEIKLNEINLLYKNIIKIFTNHFIILGIIFSIVSATLWLIILSKADLGFIYPLIGGITYIIIFFISLFILKEKINQTQLLAIIIILSGIILMIKSKWVI